jgi:flagellar biogenesis protein FliO
MDSYLFIKVMLVLIIILCMIGGIYYLFNRWNPNEIRFRMTSSQKRLKVIETLYVDPQNRLSLIQCDEETHLIALGPHIRLIKPSITSFSRSEESLCEK